MRPAPMVPMRSLPSAGCAARALRPQDRGQAEHAAGDQQRAAFDIDGVAHRDLHGPEWAATRSSCRRPDRATGGRAGPTIASVSAGAADEREASRFPPHRRRPRRACARRDAAARPSRADAAPKDKLRILILGGTGFTGPHQVRYALERGHHVTLFNRGRRPQPWPGDVVELTRRSQHRRPEVARGRRVGRLHRQPDDAAVLGARRGPRAEGPACASSCSSRRSRSTPPTTRPTRTRSRRDGGVRRRRPDGRDAGHAAGPTWRSTAR